MGRQGGCSKKKENRPLSHLMPLNGYFSSMFSVNPVKLNDMFDDWYCRLTALIDAAITAILPAISSIISILAPQSGHETVGAPPDNPGIMHTVIGSDFLHTQTS
jgi:hypothetical protein